MRQSLIINRGFVSILVLDSICLDLKVSVFILCYNIKALEHMPSQNSKPIENCNHLTSRSRPSLLQ